jgi:hypothetical protein
VPFAVICTVISVIASTTYRITITSQPVICSRETQRSDRERPETWESGSLSISRHLVEWLWKGARQREELSRAWFRTQSHFDLDNIKTQGGV